MAYLAGVVLLELDQPQGRLGADPPEAILHFLGEWALRGLLLALSVTPLRRLTRFSLIARQRRLVGLFAFAYVLLHFLAYLVFYLELDLGGLAEDIVQRPYITVGFLALLCLVPLAATSTNGWQRRLGRRWRVLHRLVFPAAVLGVAHYIWSVRDGYGEALIYTIWLMLLLGERLRARRVPR